MRDTCEHCGGEGVIVMLPGYAAPCLSCQSFERGNARRALQSIIDCLPSVWASLDTLPWWSRWWWRRKVQRMVDDVPRMTAAVQQLELVEALLALPVLLPCLRCGMMRCDVGDPYCDECRVRT